MMLNKSKLVNFHNLTLVFPVIFWCLFVLFRQWSFSFFFLGLGLLIGFGFFFLEDKKLPQTFLSDIFEIQKIVRSLLFFLLLIPVSLFVITSTGSLLGLGLVIGLNTSLCLRYFSLRNNKQKLISEFFAQLKRLPTDQEIKFLQIFWLFWITGLWLIVLFF